MAEETKIMSWEAAGGKAVEARQESAGERTEETEGAAASGNAGPASEGVEPGSPTPPKKKLRRGKWTPEEEMFVERIIRDFNAGLLDVPAGTTLRTFLSQKLNCDPMRITKKFTGASCIGKRVFHPRDRSAAVVGELARAKEALAMLEARWRARLREMESESGKQKGRSGNAKSLDKQQQNEWQVLIGNWMQRAEQALRSPTTNLHELDLLKEEGRRLRARSAMESEESKAAADASPREKPETTAALPDAQVESGARPLSIQDDGASEVLCNLKVER